MNIGIPKETHPGEKRVSFIPSSVDRMVKRGAVVTAESGLGATIGFTDDDYIKVGASIQSDRRALLGSSDIVLRLRKPPIEEVSQLKKGSLHVSFLDPFNEKALVDELAKNQISSISMEMIPRT